MAMSSVSLERIGNFAFATDFFFPLTVGSTRGHRQYDNTNSPASLNRYLHYHLQ